MPAKSYEGSRSSEPALRYFVDKFPLYLDSSNGSSSPVVTLSYVDPGQASLAGFAHHLHAYLPLFQYLAKFQFVYIAASTVDFVRAKNCFASLVKAPLRQTAPEELERYFRLREAWDRKQYGMLSSEDLEWLDQAAERFGGPRVEWLYNLWNAEDAGKDERRKLLAEALPAESARFETFLVNRGRRND